MKNSLIIFTMMLMVVACSSRKAPQIYVGDATPRKTEIYQIQEGDNTIGYAEKYDWESPKGEPRYHYFFYNLEGMMVGYVRGDGLTEEYLPNGSKQKLGNFPLEGAAERIFDTTGSVHIFTARLKDVPVQTKSVVIKKSSKKTAVAKKTSEGAKESAPEGEDDFTGEEGFDDQQIEW